MKTIEFVIGKWPAIFEHYGLPPVTGKRHYKGECPSCGKKNKYRCDDKNGTGSWVCVCGSGNGWKILEIATSKDFKTLAGEIDSAFGNTFKGESAPKQTGSRLSAAMARVKSSQKIKGTNAQAYLNSRGIYDMPTKGSFSSNGNMYSIATDSLGKPVYSHETYLDGDKKASVEITKKAISLVPENQYIDMAVIRLFEVTSTLGIAEGIETALSCKQIYKCNTWSTMNSGFMKKFRAPTGVSHLIIFADNDKNGTGLAAAFECGRANVLAKNDVSRVTIRWPGDVEDFNDMLLKGSQVFEWKLTK